MPFTGACKAEQDLPVAGHAHATLKNENGANWAAPSVTIKWASRLFQRYIAWAEVVIQANRHRLVRQIVPVVESPVHGRMKRRIPGAEVEMVIFVLRLALRSLLSEGL